MKKNAKWWSQGVQFECQGSSQCCLSRGEYGYVYLTLKDRRSLARFFKITTREFTKIYCAKTDGYFHLKEEKSRPSCMYLNGKKCSVYLARPTQCRTWPFWPEHMSAKSWSKEVASFCPGVGKGKLIPAATILEILKEQARSDKEL